jgi:hypothetical protein
MRHLVGVLLAIVMAAVVFFAASWGYLKLLSGAGRPGALPANGGSLLHHRTVVEGFAALLAAGLLAGILVAVPRISPLAAGLPGLVLLAWTGLYLDSVRRAVQYIPLKSHPYGAGFEALLFNGVLALAGLAMIIPLFVPSRWRRRLVAAAVPAAPAGSQETGSPDAEPTQTMAGDSVFSWSETTTRPQPRIEPGQAPWGPADYSG